MPRADAARMREIAERSSIATSKRKIQEAILEEDAGELLQALNVHGEGIEAFKGMRAHALGKLFHDLASKNERIRQAAYLRVLEMTDGKPGQRDEKDEPTEIVFRTEAIPADGTIRYEPAEKSALDFEL